MEDLFLTNKTKITFLEKIKEALNNCTAFFFSVSFIKKAGLVLFQKELEKALARGVKGTIITSTYQNFTDIASLKVFNSWMKKYPNFTCHIDFQCFGYNGFHSKGYLLEYNNSYEFIVGSTNITRFALLKNVEWNVSLYSSLEFASYASAKEEFDTLLQQTLLLNEDIIKKYTMLLEYAIEKWDMDYFNPEISSIKPNKMQRKALKELRRYRDNGVKKALIIAATGSGKTYLAAFDAKNFSAKRVLFVVHRDTILSAAMDTFMNVFGAEKSYGLFTGKEQDITCDFVFSMNTMLSKHLDEFTPNEFDYIVLDECHHASASSYQKIMNYFNPEFILGLTATPERMDNQDIYELFEKNVPFELRLRDAIINDLVVPFHYYAIRDEFADYSSQDKSKIAREIANNANVSFIASQIENYKEPNEKLKCLAFCTSIAHARTMADELLNFGYDAVALTGENNLGERIKCFNDLQDETKSLEIICTVDILNEGVDIPAVNMVLFLRPTESSTIFLQQLGRGLRKYENKQYLTVLDFIGNNYERSVQIALALGTLGKTTYTEKSYLKDLITNNFNSILLPGVEIFFDKLAKTEVINYLDRTNFNKIDFLKKDYENFKKYIACSSYPTHMDYLNSDIAPDLIRFLKAKINSKKNKSYYSFLKKIDEENIPVFTEEENTFIDTLSDMLPLVRPNEYLIINALLDEPIQNYQLDNYSVRITKDSLEHAQYYLEKQKILIDKKLNLVSPSKDFILFLKDLLEYGLTRYEKDFGDFEGKFKLFGNYYKEQIMLVLLEEGLMFMKGTKFVQDETYCFVGLKKDKTKEERLNYKDKFIDSSTFQWESENNTTRTNSTGIKLQNTKTVHLFVRKVDDENGITLPFTYFGTGKFVNCRDSHVKVVEKEGIKTVPTLLYDILLDNKVSPEYFLDFNIPENIIES